MLYARSRSELGSLLSRVVAILWWEVSRPVLLFSRGIARIFHGVVTFGNKNQEEICSCMSTFHPIMRPNATRTTMSSLYDISTLLVPHIYVEVYMLFVQEPTKLFAGMRHAFWIIGTCRCGYRWISLLLQVGYHDFDAKVCCVKKNRWGNLQKDLS